MMEVLNIKAKLKQHFDQSIMKKYFVEVFYSTSITLVFQELYCSLDEFNKIILRCQMLPSLQKQK